LVLCFGIALLRILQEINPLQLTGTNWILLNSCHLFIAENE
jgi:hypothetical protein